MITKRRIARFIFMAAVSAVALQGFYGVAMSAQTDSVAKVQNPQLAQLTGK